MIGAAGRGRHSLGRHTGRVVIVALGVAVAVAALAIGIVNLVVVKRIPGAAEAWLRDTHAMDVRVGSVRYLPGFGLRAKDVTVRTADGTSGGGRPALLAGVSVDRLTIRLPPGVLGLRRRVAELEIPRISADSAIRWLPRFAGNLSHGGMLPRVVRADGVSVQVRESTGASFSLDAGRVEFRSRRDAQVALVAAGGSNIDGELTIDVHSGETEVSGSLSALPLRVAPFTGGTADVAFTFGTDGHNRAVGDGAIAVHAARLRVPAIADKEISGIDLAYEFAATIDPAAPLDPRYRAHPIFPPPEYPRGTVSVTRGTMKIGALEFEFRPVIRGLFGTPHVAAQRSLPAHVHLDLVLPETPASRILGAIPAELAGELGSTVMTGTVGWELRLDVPFDDISQMHWTSVPRVLNFAVERINRSVNVFVLNDAFVHTIREDSIGYARTIRIPAARPASMAWMVAHSEHTERQITDIRDRNRVIGASRPPVTEQPAAAGRPGLIPDPALPADPTYQYVRVDDMSPWVIRAVLTAEDGDFFFYGGINPVTFADAVALNLDAGEIRYGASTISMQLVKMLFLDQERIFSRKLQEAFLVYLMEHQVPVSKERILELYLNLVEFGPGIYGVHDAAMRYFGKDPRDLTAGEATWLASILPSPKTYYRFYEDGAINESWFRRMVRIFDIMVERGRMTTAEYQDAVSIRPTFAGRSRSTGEDDRAEAR